MSWRPGTVAVRRWQQRAAWRDRLLRAKEWRDVFARLMTFVRKDGRPWTSL